MRRLAAAGVLLGSLLASAEQPDPRLFDTLVGLRAVVTAPDDMDVPPVVRELLASLKGELRDLVLRCVELEGGDAERARACVQEHVRASSPQPGGGEDEPVYGWIHDVTLERPEGHPGLLVATTTISLPCGSDTSLYVLRRSDGALRVVHTVESSGYAEAYDAQNGLEYRLSPPVRGREPLLLTVSMNPFCASNWQGIRWRLSRLGTSSPIASGDDGFYFPSGWEIELEPDGFLLSYTVAHGLDAARWARENIVHRRIAGDGTVRVDPIAGDATGFLSEWVEMPWDDAVAVTDPRAAERTRAWHESLNACDYSSEFVSIEPFFRDGEPGVHHLLSLDVAGRDGCELPRLLLFVVAEPSPSAYRLLAVGSEEELRAAGELPDLEREGLGDEPVAPGIEVDP